jgi:PAS domain S-box-containing protein
MSWVTIIWSMVASACLTLAAVNLLVWCKKRTEWANLLFSLTAVGTAGMAYCELWMMRAETPGQFGTALRWLHVPAWALLVALVGFVRLYLRAGRPWLAWSFIGLRTLSLLLDFLVGQNLNYREITGLRHIPFFGESVSVAEGVVNPCMLVGQLSLLLLVLFVADATATVWRRGDRRQALAVGGSIVFFTLAGTVQAVLVLWEMVHWPMTTSFFYLGIVATMAYEMSREALRAAQLSDDLRESEERMTLASEAAGFGVWMWSIARNQVWGSERWLRLFGFAPDTTVTFEKIIQRVHPDDREGVEHAVRRAAAGGGDYAAEYRLVLPDNTQRWVAARGRVYPDTQGKPVRMMGATIDITASKQAEDEAQRQHEELAHLSRVTTVSELSGSLAHELNQPLAIILTNAQAAQRLLAQQPPDLAEAREILADIVSEDQRAGEVIRRLRSLLKHGETSLQPLTVNGIVEEVLQLSRNSLIGHGITVHRSLAPNVPQVQGDHIQLQQVLLNLILNACDAMAANPPAGRQLTLATAHSDGAVRISVSDTGCGLPRVAERVFQPFYTTKKHGLGLGLPICRSIVTAHKGRLWAENGAARGAVFHLELPTGGQVTSNQ